MTTDGRIRPLDLNQDLDQLNKLFEICFSDELTNRGGDFGEELRSAQKIMAIFSFLGRFSDGLRYLFNGFVWEENGKIVSTVTVQRSGNVKNRWEIAMVATHPDYRRQGLSRKLMDHALKFAKDHGAEICILYVLAENKPAYTLYRKLGFEHYDSTTELKLEEAPKVKVKTTGQYTIRPMKISEWQTRYKVALKDAPADVQAFLPVEPDQFKLSILKRLLVPLIMRLQKLKTSIWAAEYEGEPVAYLILDGDRTGKKLHNLRWKMDPAHQDALAEPMLTLALETLQELPQLNTLITIRTACTGLLDLLKKYGFTEIETQHWLGVKGW